MSDIPKAGGQLRPKSPNAEREQLRVSYLRQKPKKEQPGRLALPSHLPVVETIVEPSEDTTGMIHIGREITEELDYSHGTLHINRIIRNKYITKEDELGNQKQVIARLSGQSQSVLPALLC